MTTELAELVLGVSGMAAIKGMKGRLWKVSAVRPDGQLVLVPADGLDSLESIKFVVAGRGDVETWGMEVPK